MKYTVCHIMISARERDKAKRGSGHAQRVPQEGGKMVFHQYLIYLSW